MNIINYNHSILFNFNERAFRHKHTHADTRKQIKLGENDFDAGLFHSRDFFLCLCVECKLARACVMLAMCESNGNNKTKQMKTYK